MRLRESRVHVTLWIALLTLWLRAPVFSSSETTPDVRALTLNGSNPEVLPQFVAAAHKNVRRCVIL